MKGHMRHVTAETTLAMLWALTAEFEFEGYLFVLQHDFSTFVLTLVLTTTMTSTSPLVDAHTVDVGIAD